MIQAPRLWDVVEEHLDDAAFLWEQWERALSSPVQRPTEIAAHVETRLRANLEGLRIACPEVIDRLLLPALGSIERGRVAAVALVLAEQPGGLQHLLGALRTGGPESDEPIARALGLATHPGLEAGLVAALDLRDGRTATVVLEALAFRKVDPGPPLLDFLRSGEPLLKAAALRAAHASRQAVRLSVETACASPHPAVRDAAVRTALRLGLRTGYTSCERLLDTDPAAPALLYEVLAMGGDPAALPRLVAGLERPATRRDALTALGSAGWAEAVPRILECADDPSLSRLAGEAFAAIAGVEIDGPFLAEEPTDDEPPAFEDDDFEGTLVDGPEADLPAPEPDALRSWWARHGNRLDPAVRLLDGAPWTPERQLEVFLGAAARRRGPLALELSVRTRGQWEVETRGWAAAQLEAERRPVRFAAEAKLPFPRLLRA